MQPVNTTSPNMPLPMAMGAWNLSTLLAQVADRDQTIATQAALIQTQQDRIEGLLRMQRQMAETITAMQGKLSNARHAQYGASSEQIGALQLEIFQQPHESPLPSPAEDLTVPVERHCRKQRRSGRPALPPNLPVERIVHEMPAAEQACYDQVTVIGQTVTRVLKYTPGSMSVVEHVCPRYALVKDGISTVRSVTYQASPLMKSNASSELLSYLVVGRLDLGLPFNRLEEEFRIFGVHISRNTMSGWMIRLSKLVMVLYEALGRQMVLSPVLYGDDTPYRELGTKRRPVRTVRLWAYATAGQKLLDGHWVDVPRLVYYEYTPTRAGCYPKALLENYEGYLQADDYSGWQGLFRGGKIKHVACHAHARRMFIKIYRQLRKDTPATANDSLAAQALCWIRRLYMIERKAREADPPTRRAIRQAEAAPVLDQYRLWLEASFAQVLPRSDLGRAIAYTLSNWEALTRYLEDGNLDIDSNYIERQIRRVAVARKNHLFFGSEEGGRAAAVMYSLLATCRVNDVNPYDYLVDVLERINDHPINRIEELLPYNWRHRNPEAARAATVH